MQSKPEISVIMPAYNAEKYIARAINSILQQSFENFEFIIINDGSSDKTWETIQSFRDRRILLVNQPNRGIAWSLNRGLAMASASLVARFDADDIAMPERLEKQFAAFQHDPELMIAGSAADYIDEEEVEVFSWEPPAFQNHEIQLLPKTICPFIHSSVMYKKDMILAKGGYNAHAHSFEDHLLWTLVMREGKVINLPERLIKVRLNAGSITIDERWRPALFRQIKKEVLKKGGITEQEGNMLEEILKSQDKKELKTGAYHALLGKKYLWNNYQPVKARTNLKKAISLNPFYVSGYGLLAASFLPPRFIKAFYRSVKTIQ